MNMDKLISTSSKEPVVKNNLLLPGQVAYNLGLNQIIGAQNKVIYNAMGPDVSTVLYLTDPNEVIGVERDKVCFKKLKEIIYQSWENLEFGVNIHDFLGYSKIVSNKEAKELYLLQLGHRKEFGYWDNGEISNWGRERLMALELKLLGVEKDSIEIKEDSGGSFTLSFPWKHPSSIEKVRKISYNPFSTLRNLPIPNVDIFYQKSLPFWDLSLDYTKLIKKKINKGGNVFLGYWHSEHKLKNNINFKAQSKKNLGRKFKEINDTEISELIVETKRMGYYGNRLHGFSRK